MSIQSDKDRFLKGCEEMMRIQKVIIKKIEENDVRGQHHGEEAYISIENLKSVMADIKPDHIIYMKSHGGFSVLQNVMDKANETIAAQKNFYNKQLQQSEDVGEYAVKIANTMKYCIELLKKCDIDLKNLQNIIESFKRV